MYRDSDGRYLLIKLPTKLSDTYINMHGLSCITATESLCVCLNLYKTGKFAAALSRMPHNFYK